MKLLHSKILGEGAPLLILHGLLGMGDNWISLARKYAKAGFEVHLIDQRNHGQSFHSSEMSYEDLSEDLLHYINNYQLKNISIIGHSMGGKTAMFFSVENPEVVHKLIVVDIAPKYYPPHHHVIFEAIQSVDLQKYNKRTAIEDALKNSIESLAIRRFILKNVKRNEEGYYQWKPNLRVLQNSLNDLGEALLPNQIFEKPTLFIKGEQSKYILDADISLIKAHFPTANLIIINQAGHWVHAEQQEKFYQASLNFLSTD